MAVACREVDIRLDKSAILRSMGYGANSEPSARVVSLIDEYVREIEQLLEPSYTYVVKNVMAVKGARVLTEGPAVFESRVVSGLLGGCRRVGVFVATIGGRLEEMACRLSEEGSMLQASVLDAIGSEAVSRVAEFAERLMGWEAAMDGLVTSRRFSPGYCDWDISQQMMVFHAVDRDSTDVDLTDSCLMVPRKSISGIVGMGDPESGVNAFNPCPSCDRTDCPGRR
jgi:hypothetical protein